MKRDFNLIRSILLKVEDLPSGESIGEFHFEGIDPKVVAEHVELLIEAKLIEGATLGPKRAAYSVRRLTWPGHDFLANAKNDTVWKKVLAQAERKGVSVSLTVLNGLLT